MMQEKQIPAQKKPLSWRAVASIVLVISFCILLLSGSILYVSPPGRVANWTDWTLLGLTKKEWNALHLCFSLLFLFSSLVHLVYNWKALLSYFKNRQTSRYGFRWEWLIALFICFSIYFGTRLNLPPLAQWVDLGDQVGKSWPDSLRPAPTPHAELLTLQELAKVAHVETATAIERLQKEGITGFTEETVVQDIAEKSRYSPQRIYEIISGNAHPVSRQGASMGKGLGGGGGAGTGGGSGAGSLTLEEYCSQQGIALDAALEKLSNQGIQTSGNQTLRHIAINNGYSRPRDIMDILK